MSISDDVALYCIRFFSSFRSDMGPTQEAINFLYIVGAAYCWNFLIQIYNLFI